jgi:hypothetical protein
MSQGFRFGRGLFLDQGFARVVCGLLQVRVVQIVHEGDQ